MYSTHRSLAKFSIRSYSAKTHVSDVDKGIEFLKEKGVFSDDPEFGALLFSRLRDPSILSSPNQKRHYELARDRLVSLKNMKEDKHFDAPKKDIVKGDMHIFSKAEFEGYEDKNVFFLEHANTLAQRYQKKGLSYMQAPTMVQHYAVSQGLSGTIPMLDIVKYIKNIFTSKQLEKFIFENEGEDSALFLESIMRHNSNLINGGLPYDEMYERYGPGLVSRFRVHEDFADVEVHHHYGKPSGTKILGFHSMALVGYRIDKSKKKFYLLQNWWEEKQFVEVDEDYLKYSGAVLYFIETPQTKIPENFATSYGSYFALDGIDKPEGPYKELSSSE